MARHMRKNTFSNFIGSGVFQLVGKHPNPSNTANSLQATHPPYALEYCVLTLVKINALC